MLDAEPGGAVGWSVRLAAMARSNMPARAASAAADGGILADDVDGAVVFDSFFGCGE